MQTSRRAFMSWTSRLAAGATLGFAGLGNRRASALVGFGPLVADPAGVMDLPVGFSYQILQSTGDLMTDGAQVRGQPDGMAAFAGPNDTIVVMRNHELVNGGGGVSRMVLDPTASALLSSNDVLTGTSVNCAGGPSPWGWLSCEEVPGTGGVWIAPIDRTSAVPRRQRQKIDGYGSFCHEAVAVDPTTLTAYLTEDDGDSSLFRFVPTSFSSPFSGQLQAMRVPGLPRFRTNTMAVGQSIQVDWVTVNPKKARSSAIAAGAAVVVRGEGIWWFGGQAYFSATSNGEIFRYLPDGSGVTGTLTLVTRSLQAPDNVTVAPWGDVFVAEDNSVQNHLRIVDSVGNVTDFARNALNPADEFTGVCFSPGGDALFVNMQNSGLTFVVKGPFPV